MIRQEYVEQLRKHRESNADWGSSAVRNAGDFVVRYINKANQKQRNITSVLDFGCGTGTLTEYIRGNCPGVMVYQYDPSIRGIDKLRDEQYDLIVSVDVLEHVEPQNLAETLAWMNEHTHRQVHHIDCNDTKDRLPDGRDVHLIIQEPEWWEPRVAPPATGMQVMERHVHDKFKKGRFRRSCTFVIERQG